MRVLIVSALAGAFAMSCGGRSLEHIPGYNAPPVDGGSLAGAGGVAGTPGSGGRAGTAASAGAGFSGAGASGGRAGEAGSAGGSGLSGVGGGAGTDPGQAGAAGSRPDCEGAVTSDRFDPNRIYLSGTLYEGSCGVGAIAAVECPNSAAVGFECHSGDNTGLWQDEVQIVPADGRLLYLRWSSAWELREFACDQCPHLPPNTNDYPRDVAENDPLASSLCAGTGGTRQFFVSPASTLYVRCGDGDWRDESGAVVYSDPEKTLAYVGYRQLALTRTNDARYSLAGTEVIDLTSGTATPVRGLPEAPVYAMRAAPPDRFLIATATDADTPGGRWELWEVDGSGAAVLHGEYPRLPTEIGLSPGVKLLPDGVLYQMGRGPSASDDVIVRREIGGTSEVVYTEASDPHVKIHISGLVTGP